MPEINSFDDVARIGAIMLGAVLVPSSRPSTPPIVIISTSTMKCETSPFSSETISRRRSNPPPMITASTARTTASGTSDGTAGSAEEKLERLDG